MSQVTRRTLLKLGLGAGGTALAGCDREPEWIESPLHDTRRPVGDAAVYATVCKLCPLECGMHARVKTGRLKKLEGNPSWVTTGGSLCALGQAASQVLYHPQRAVNGRIRKGPGAAATQVAAPEAIAELSRQLATIPPEKVLCILPASTGHLNALTAALGWNRFSFDPARPATLTAAATRCFGVERMDYSIDQADLIVSFDADLVSRAPLAAALGNWKRRRHSEEAEQSRLVYVGPRFNLTAGSADCWLSVRPGTEGTLALALALAVASSRGVSEVASQLHEWTAERAAEICDVPLPLVEALIRRAIATRSAIAVPGTSLACYSNGPQAAQAIGLLNRLWNAPVSFGFGPPLENVAPAPNASAQQLLGALAEASAVVIVDLDLVSLCPQFRSSLKHPTAYLTTRNDATAAEADVVVPIATFLESWDDAFLDCGQGAAAGVVQPVVNPVAGVAVGDLLLQLVREQKQWPPTTYREFLKQRWVQLCPNGEDIEAFWTRLCSTGYWTDPNPRAIEPALPPIETLVPAMNAPDYDGDGLYIYMYPSPVTGGIRHSELPWLDERYDVLTGVAWCSPLELHPETAQSFGLRDGDVATFTIDASVLHAPVVLYHGIRRDTVGMPIGAAASQADWQALSSRFNAAGDQMLNGQRVTLRKNGHRVLAKAGGTLGDLGRGLAILERRPA